MANTTAPHGKAEKDITKWASEDGEFRRQASTFRESIQEGGRFAPEKDRYILYVSLACPWAQRTLIVRQLKGLESIIRVSVVHHYMGAQGWSWKVGPDDQPDAEGVIPDPLYGFEKIRQLYFKADESYEGRFTVPILWDSKEATIVNNESSEIIRNLNHGFDSLLSAEPQKIDLYPEALRGEIDELNSWVYDTVNNGVYKSGFATSQSAYDSAVKSLFDSLGKLEKHLENGKEWLIGGKMTEADVRLYTTIVRFDPVYVGHFKCNVGTIRANYPNLHLWLRRLYWNIPAFKDTTNFTHIKSHYYRSHPQINPTRIVPIGPEPDIMPL